MRAATSASKRALPSFRSSLTVICLRRSALVRIRGLISRSRRRLYIQSAAMPSEPSARFTIFDRSFANRSTSANYIVVCRGGFSFFVTIHGFLIRACISAACTSNAIDKPQALSFAAICGGYSLYIFLASTPAGIFVCAVRPGRSPSPLSTSYCPMGSPSLSAGDLSHMTLAK